MSFANQALAAEVACEGLWEWDLRTQECFYSGPWRALVGLAAGTQEGAQGVLVLDSTSANAFW